MAYCTNCGERLIDGANFCGACGSAICNMKQSTRKSVYEGELHKCPSCGEIVKAFEFECPSCGHEFRTTNVSGIVKEFAHKLEMIDAQPDTKRFFWHRKPRKSELSEKEKRKISLIRSFPIPNTKEDLLEFMILASSNMEVDDWKMSAGRKAISRAWQAKFEQAYQKAKISFSDSKDFKQIENLYSEKYDSLNNRIQTLKEKHDSTESTILLLGMMFILFLIIWVIM